MRIVAADDRAANGVSEGCVGQLRRHDEGRFGGGQDRGRDAAGCLLAGRIGSVGIGNREMPVPAEVGGVAFAGVMGGDVRGERFCPRHRGGVAVSPDDRPIPQRQHEQQSQGDAAEQGRGVEQRRHGTGPHVRYSNNSTPVATAASNPLSAGRGGGRGIPQGGRFVGTRSHRNARTHRTDQSGMGGAWGFRLVCSVDSLSLEGTSRVAGRIASKASVTFILGGLPHFVPNLRVS